MRPLNEKIIEKILEVLQNTVWGMTIEDISEATKHHRNTVAKYMPELKKLGFVVTRTIGKYTFWLPSTMYAYHKTNVARLFFQKLGTIIGNYAREKKRIDPFTLGREIGKKLTADEIYQDEDTRLIMRQDEEIVKLGIFVPTILPRVKYKVDPMDLKSNKIKISVAGCPCDGEEKYKDSCKLMEGFIFGIIEQLGITPTSIKETECMIDGAEACKFEVTLSDTIEKLLKDYSKKYKET